MVLELNELIKRCIRIIYISRKPTAEEFEKVAKVTSLGMVAFGLIGFVISLIFRFIR
jgi:protein transport protein SEC61 subunit gamma-like protein